MAVALGFGAVAAPLLAQPRPSATAVARGPCANAVNAAGGSIVQIHQVCNYSTLSAQDRRTIDRLVARAQQNVVRLRAVDATVSAQQTAVRALAQNDQTQNEQISELRNQLASALQLIKELAAAPGASSDVRNASIRLEQGDVAPAARILGQEARATAQGGSGPQPKAAALLLQEAALLQTEDLERSRAVLNRALDLDPENVSALWMAAGLAQNLGDIPGALGYYERIRAVTAAQLEVRPDDVLLLRDMSNIHNAIGVAHSFKGDYTAAVASLTESLKRAEALASRDPTNAEWLRNVGVAYASLGDVEANTGHTQVALDHYKRGFDIAETLLKRFPLDMYRYDLAGRHARIGDVEGLRGHTEASLKAYQEALTLIKALVAASPTVEAGYFDLAMLYGKIAYQQLSRGEVAAAQESYRNGIDLATKRAAQSPNPRAWQRQIELLYGGLGDAQLSEPIATPAEMARISATALESYSSAHAIALELSTRDPANDLWQYDLWYALSRLGVVQSMRGENQAALSNYKKALAVLEALAAKYPGVVIYQRQLGLTHGKMGAVQVAQGLKEEALANYAEALKHAEAARALDPKVIEFDRDMAFYHGSIALVHAQTGDPAAGTASVRKSIEWRRKVVASDQGNALWQVDLAQALYLLGTYPTVPTEERRKALQEALAILTKQQATGGALPMVDGMVSFTRLQLEGLEGPAASP